MWVDDQIMCHSDESFYLKSFVPKSTFVVLGSSNKAETESILASCRANGIDVLRRYGGGGTVLLYPGCCVVSLGLWVKDRYENNRYFYEINQSIIDCLAVQIDCFKKLSQDGISDIVFGPRKVAGTSMFRSRNYLLFQASILVECDQRLIEEYLAHPSKEPEYRKGRSHRDFLIGLSEISEGVTPSSVSNFLQENLEKNIRCRLKNDLVPPIEEQIAHIKRKAQV